MKALTLTQPWATLVALGAKTFETRSWSTAYRGPLAIHAAKGFSGIGGKRGFLEICAHEPFARVLEEARLAPADLPLGAVVATAKLTQSAPTRSVQEYLRGAERFDELAFGDYSDGRYAFELVYIRALPTPVTATGALGLWDLPDSADPDRSWGVSCIHAYPPGEYCPVCGEITVDPYEDKDFDDEGFVLACTHCNGEGTCDANTDPLGNCGEEDHPCHACNGTGDRRDQVIF